MPLETYRKKRDFSRTPEPKGSLKLASKRAATTKAKAAKGFSFVIQKHAASHLHYDFRLELHGVLLSWAVPKGPSLDPADKRLAVHVEDHPLEYGDFEGVIPKGEYGGGTVLLWDRGRWIPEGDPEEGYRKGSLKFRLEGDKLQGRWALVQTHGPRSNEGKNWLLIKERDEVAASGAAADITARRPLSVSTGRDLDAIAGDRDRVWHSDRDDAPRDEPKPGSLRARFAAARKDAVGADLRVRPAAKKKSASSSAKKTTARKTAARGATRATSARGARKLKGDDPLPAQPAVELATLVDEAPDGDAWVHEIKFDGYRILARLDDGAVTLLSRNGHDWTAQFGAVADAVAALPARRALLDGEVCVVTEDGTTSFQALQNVMKGGGRGELTYFVFDMLHLDGVDLTRRSLLERKEALAGLLEGARGPLRTSEHVVGNGRSFHEQACRYRLEGIVSKRADSPYRAGRGKDWLKVKCFCSQEFVIGGYTDPEGSRTGFGALLVGFYDERGELRYAGKVGTGYSDQVLRELRQRMKDVRQPAFVDAPRGYTARGFHYVEPSLVAQVRFTEWTDGGQLRHPSFDGLREDKDPKSVRREAGEVSGAGVADAGPAARRSGPRAKRPTPSARRGTGDPVEVGGVKLSHPDRVLYPEQGITKHELAEYYEQIAEWILPELAGRPLSVVRCPEGHDKECFFQKHAHKMMPHAIKQVMIAESAGPRPYLMVDDLLGLVSLVQMGALELHTWGAPGDDVEHPDRMVIDLDPGPGVAWSRVVEGARLVRETLERIGLVSFVKTSGGKGLHVVVPFKGRRPGWDDMKEFSRRVAESLARAHPDRFVAVMSKSKREGRIYLDYLRNARGATAVAAYSTRSRSGAPVSAPLGWDELPASKGPDQYNVRNLPARLSKLKHDPWEDIASIRQTITATMKKNV